MFLPFYIIFSYLSRDFWLYKYGLHIIKINKKNVIREMYKMYQIVLFIRIKTRLDYVILYFIYRIFCVILQNITVILIIGLTEKVKNVNKIYTHKYLY